MKQPLNPPCRLHALFAREADVAVIFRRGPTKWTQLIAWDTKADTLTYGQWFKGRIYEKRCDLSPDGSKLIYFAAKYCRPALRSTAYTETWTAVSRPPYLTALAPQQVSLLWRGGQNAQNGYALRANPNHTLWSRYAPLAPLSYH
ncbi:hypothetical protein F8S13_27540, partial [Chloroflexia bacterium SDU3-3]